MNKIIKYIELMYLIVTLSIQKSEAISTKSARVIKGISFFGSLGCLLSGSTLLAIKMDRQNYRNI